SGLLNWFIKEIFKLTRIIGMEGIRSLRVETAGGYSFPSGHTQSAASFWTVLMVKFRKKWFYVLAVVMMILVAISRLYLGVHRPLDVIFGLIIGFAWVFAANIIFKFLEKDDIKAVVIIIPVVFLLMLYVQNHTFYKAAGSLISILLGYIVEKRYIKYSVKSAIGFQILKVIVGFTIMIFIKEGLKVLLPDTIWSEFFRYFVMGCWLIIGSTKIYKTFIPQKG
ncbi:MAG: phosphatase PAP2 family protein, partial [Halanaerobiales bacterium]